MQVLNAMQQLSSVKNLFFVLAADEAKLRKCVEEQSERADGGDPDFALEKYIQHATWVPPIEDGA